jgi:hypothetical protein
VLLKVKLTFSALLQIAFGPTPPARQNRTVLLINGDKMAYLFDDLQKFGQEHLELVSKSSSSVAESWLVMMDSDAERDDAGSSSRTTCGAGTEKREEAINIFQNSVIPAAKQQKGFISLMMLTERSTGKEVSVCLWETEGWMKA